MRKVGFLLVIFLVGCAPSAEMCEEYYSNGFQAGREQGHEEGYEEGHEEGYDEGYGIVEEICGGDATCSDYY